MQPTLVPRAADDHVGHHASGGIVKTIESIEQLVANLLEFDSYRASATPDELDFYRQRLRLEPKEPKGTLLIWEPKGTLLIC